MKKKIFRLYQDGKLFFEGDKDHLCKMTKLSRSTIDKYCRPGFLESTRNETNTKIVEVKEGKNA